MTDLGEGHGTVDAGMGIAGTGTAEEAVRRVELGDGGGVGDGGAGVIGERAG